MGGYTHFGDRILADVPSGLLAVSPGYVSDEEDRVEQLPSGVNLYRGSEVVRLADLPIFDAVVSPNRQQIASFRDKTVTIIDLETFSQTTFDTQEFLQIVAWGGDNTIYYSSITPVRDLMADLTVDEKG